MVAGVRQDRGRIWIDVTTILRWKRPVVGVVRVEEQLARWLLRHPDQAFSFCRYDRTTGAYRFVSKKRVAARIKFYDRLLSKTAALRSARAEALSKPAGDVAERTPWTMRIVALKAYFRARLNKTRSVVASARKALGLGGAGTTDRQATQELLSGFRAGDVYVSVGSDWDDKDLGKLYRHKKALEFKMLGICYDTIPVQFPDLALENTARNFARHLTDLAWVCDHVMCISYRTQSDFLAFIASMGARTPRTSVIRLGGALLSSGADRASEELAAAANGERSDIGISDAVRRVADRRFVLFVSTLEKRKNHETLYAVWTKLLAEGNDVPDLVFVGMIGWGTKGLLDHISNDARAKDRIHVLSRVSDLDLVHLYRRCEYTVYPSLYEGWGLPVEESFAFGKLCLCSNTGSLPEVGGNMAEYLDPLDVDAWASRIRYFNENPEELARRNRHIAATFKPYSWQETASSIVRLANALMRGEAENKPVQIEPPA